MKPIRSDWNCCLFFSFLLLHCEVTIFIDRWKSKRNWATLDMFVHQMNCCYIFVVVIVFGWKKKNTVKMMTAFVSLQPISKTANSHIVKVTLEEKAPNFDKLAFLWCICVCVYGLSISQLPFCYSLPLCWFFSSSLLS